MIAQAEVQFMTVAAQYGVPLVLLVWVVYSLRQGATWVGANVVHPLASKHVEFLDSTRATMERQANSAEQTARILEALREHQQAQTEALNEIKQNTSRLACVNSRATA